MNTLGNKNLPLLELKEILASISGRIPLSIEVEIRQVMTLYEKNMTSSLVQFPCHQIAHIIDQYAVSLQANNDRNNFMLTMDGAIKLIQRYRNGLRGHMKENIRKLLNIYYETEHQFQHASFEKCVTTIQEHNKANSQLVVEAIFSHSQVKNKSVLVTMLLDHLQTKELGLVNEMADLLSELTLLNGGTDHSIVSLKARHLLLAACEPSYDIRYGQMESILLSGIDTYGYNYSPTKLRRLVMSESSIFDILHDFFYYVRDTICYTALEVYLRRAYASYEIISVRHITEYRKHLDIPVVYFEYVLPIAHRTR